MTMFFVPIAAIILLAWFVMHCIGTFHSANYDTNYKRVSNRLDYLKNNYSNQDLQTKIEREHEKQYDLNKQIVSDFMGGDYKWREFTSPYLGEVLATSVILAQQGMIDTRYLSTLNIITNGIKDPQESAKMKAQFILALEKELGRHGVFVTSMFQNPLGNTNDTPTQLKAYISQNGYDGIFPMAHFWFQ